MLHRQTGNSHLTGKDFNGNVTAATQLQREEYFARTFKGLGHQIHLIQDMAVPDYVRNDAHPEDATFGKLNINKYFESWAKSEQQRIIDLASNSNLFVSPAVSYNISYNNLASLTQLFDAEQYNGSNPSITLTQGLSEYTNANFFSEDTIFATERYAAGILHHVMARGIEESLIFRDGYNREDFIHRLSELAVKKVWIECAWELMLKHFHLLIYTGNDLLSVPCKSLF